MEVTISLNRARKKLENEWKKEVNQNTNCIPAVNNFIEA